MKKLDVFIISWEGKNDKADDIAKACIPHAETTVIYSTNNNNDFEKKSPCKWIKLDNHNFFGPKFSTCLEEKKSGDHLLIIHADTKCNDWGELIKACAKALNNYNIGVWSPTIEFTPYPNHANDINHISKEIISVIQTDGIIFGIHDDICNRLRKFNYSANNLGWGIDWAAIAIARTQGKVAARDPSIKATHPRGSGYNNKAAEEQMNMFMKDLTPSELDQYLVLSELLAIKKSKESLFKRLLQEALQKPRNLFSTRFLY